MRLIAQAGTTAPAGPSGQAMAWYLTLWGLLAVGSLFIVVFAAAVVLVVRRAMARARARQGRVEFIKDAWSEAGRRAEPATVDLEPGELSGDADGEGPR